MAYTRKRIIQVLLLIAVLIGAFGLGYFLRGQGEADKAVQVPGGEQVITKEYTCSMHPQIRQPEPGLCPVCAMDLIPVTGNSAGSDGPRELTLSENAITLAEIQTAPVEQKFVQVEIPLVGKITYDETKRANITTWVPGRLERMFVNYTGIHVNKGDHLIYLYSQELYVIQAEYLIQRRAGKANASEARNRLLLAGMTEAQVQELERTGKPQLFVTIYSPASGTVVEKHGLEGQYVVTGTKVYTIADLSRVWLVMDAYESDMPWIRYGQTVTFTTEAYPGTVFTGTVAFISPTLDDRTRTVELRVNVDNTSGKLKPGFFVRATVHATVAGEGKVISPSLAGKWISPMHPEVIKDEPGTCDVCGIDLVPIESLGYVTMDEETMEPPLVIPATAPLLTGKRAVVYVAIPRQEGTFESREIVLGPRAGDYYIVRSGLRKGEQVVVHGNFKIDSAMQILTKSSMMSMPDDTAVREETNQVINFNNTHCPVMGGEVNGKDFIEYNGIRYGICCLGCDKTFLADPGKYVAGMPNKGRINDLGNMHCPIMGGEVNKDVFIIYNGYKVYFCCPGCDKQFMKNPDKFLNSMVSSETQSVNNKITGEKQ
jgi:Cu(I)/Ag(I) efflux system membrane fusion protein